MYINEQDVCANFHLKIQMISKDILKVLLCFKFLYLKETLNFLDACHSPPPTLDPRGYRFFSVVLHTENPKELRTIKNPICIHQAEPS